MLGKDNSDDPGVDRVEKERKPMSRYTTRNRFGRTRVHKDVGSWKIWPE